MSIRLKSILNTLIQFAGALLIGYYFNHLFEIIVIIPLFFLFRHHYKITYHAKTIARCTISTLLMFVLIALVLQPRNTSILITIVICFLTTQCLYCIGLAEETLKVKRFKVYIGIPEDILRKKCEMYNLSDIETQVLVLYYCKHLKRWQIGNELGYSEDNISKIKRRALDKFV